MVSSYSSFAASSQFLTAGPDMTIDDLLNLSPKFWQLHNDPITVMDFGTTTLLSIQYNLCAGTIARYTARRPELIPLVEDLLKYRKQYVILPILSRYLLLTIHICSGQFMMTELGHGLDIGNIETTATLTSTGEFILNSPTPSAAKYVVLSFRRHLF